MHSSRCGHADPTKFQFVSNFHACSANVAEWDISRWCTHAAYVIRIHKVTSHCRMQRFGARKLVLLVAYAKNRVNCGKIIDPPFSSNPSISRLSRLSSSDFAFRSSFACLLSFANFESAIMRCGRNIWFTSGRLYTAERGVIEFITARWTFFLQQFEGARSSAQNCENFSAAR